MKENLKKIIGIVIVVMFIIMGINRLGYLLRPISTDNAFNAINTFHNIPIDSIEVMGYGSSHMWMSVNPIELYSSYGIGAYNYGCTWQQLNTTLLFLKDSLKTQSPRIALIETYFVHEYKENTDMDGEIYYTTEIDNVSYKWEYLKQCFGNKMERYISYYMPLCAYHDNWVNIGKQNFQNRLEIQDDFYRSKGFLRRDEVTKIELPNCLDFEQKELDGTSYKILDEIVKTCKENNIEIIFFTAPWKGEYKYSDVMEQYAKENDCIYFNMFEYVDEIGLNGSEDFYDEGHLNVNGANKVSNFLGKYIVENYEVTDYRTIKDNLWSKDYSR